MDNQGLTFTKGETVIWNMDVALGNITIKVNFLEYTRSMKFAKIYYWDNNGDGLQNRTRLQIKTLYIKRLEKISFGKDFKGLDLSKPEPDTNLIDALREKPQMGFVIEDIKQILAGLAGYFEMESATYNWIWIVALNNGKFAYLEGGCPFNNPFKGFGSQGYLSSAILNDPTDGIELVNYTGDVHEFDIKTSLAQQLSKSKNITW